ncbi:hypothetical protein [Streptomyces sp. JJ36]|uniref:hypothetical protein n=1 Tax=Streptomyces sp. JJ36 TaxID=2736645 RepID=UPI001F1A4905|nr:hypothetical protein [Streptomyces sp. JJ36]MCF6525926.1 hypothetical protein [Streptomyces sp. JJ36]
MAQIVGVHGIGWAWKSRAGMHDLWQAALREGLENIRSPHAAELSFATAFYGHLYNAPSGKAGGEPGYGPGDVAAGLEYDLLEAMAEAAPGEAGGAGALSGTAGAEAVTKGWPARGTQAFLSALEGTPFLGSLTASGIIRMLKQVHRYFEDPVLRKEVRAEVAAALGPETRVVVAHSLGSVAAYETLWEHRGSRIGTFVTLGSPLGLAAIRRRLAPTGTPPGLPPSVDRWVNVAAEHDVVALNKRLRGPYGEEVVDEPVVTPRLRFHDCTRYLSNVKTAHAVAAALG